MPALPETPAGLFVRDDDEGLFSRDINGQLVRLDAPTESDYDKIVTLQIDGQSVTVPLAEPLKDANGNIVQDIEGRTTPRYTTIYDAAAKLYVNEPGDEAKIPIPTLCHLPHMRPVAVCRLCVVQIYGQKRGRRAAERKLLPACQHPVKDGMEVFTMNAAGADGERVRQAVKSVTELLASDHLKPAPDPQLAPFNELQQATDRCGGNASHYRIDVMSKKAPPAPAPRGRRALDASSPVFMVDHSACILCDRCVRACDEVMENNVIGRTGKGANAGIGFDLNDCMGESTCVQCGECLVSCPTTAITFKPVAKVKPRSRSGSAEIVSPAELVRDPVFAGVPPKFLLWQQGLVVRRHLRRGQYLCREGEAGNTAFIIKSGKLEAAIPLRGVRAGGSFIGNIFQSRNAVARAQLTAADLIAGEMACLSGSPRTADIRVAEEAEIWEIRRNVLDRLMRLPSRRAKFEGAYRSRSLSLVLQDSELFRDLDQSQYNEIVEFVRERLSFVRVNPGQLLFEQGDEANDLFIVRLGHVRVGIHRHQNEVRVLSRGPGAIIGEIGLLGLSTRDITRSIDEVDNALARTLNSANGNIDSVIPAGVRTASCSALTYLELARLSRKDFLELIRRFPVLRRRLVEQSLGALRSNSDINPLMTSYVEQGLFEGQNILALDLDLCTRCDECTKGCVERHGTATHGLPITRLLRDGMRFGDFLIATSCRSCTTPHCMSGCPVDSIHRGKHLQIVIEDHCIGCGLCASNCPYGNIFMVPNRYRTIEAPDPDNPAKTTRIAQLKAATCDLCDAKGVLPSPSPQCVASCPHEAAMRLTGPELLRIATERRDGRWGH